MQSFQIKKNEDVVFANRVLRVAHLFKTMKDLSAHFNVSAFTMRYRLGKARKLDEVKSLLIKNKLNELTHDQVHFLKER